LVDLGRAAAAEIFAGLLSYRTYSISAFLDEHKSLMGMGLDKAWGAKNK
jgi:hypothetical protein